MLLDHFLVRYSHHTFVVVVVVMFTMLVVRLAFWTSIVVLRNALNFVSAHTTLMLCLSCHMLYNPAGWWFSYFGCGAARCVSGPPAAHWRVRPHRCRLEASYTHTFRITLAARVKNEIILEQHPHVFIISRAKMATEKFVRRQSAYCIHFICVFVCCCSLLLSVCLSGYENTENTQHSDTMHGEWGNGTRQWRRFLANMKMLKNSCDNINLCCLLPLHSA